MGGGEGWGVRERVEWVLGDAGAVTNSASARLAYFQATAACAAACPSWCTPDLLEHLSPAPACRLALHQPGGPVRALVDNLMAAGQRWTRVMALVALQLCGVWARWPHAAAPYQDVLQALCLFGMESDGGLEVGGFAYRAG